MRPTDADFPFGAAAAPASTGLVTTSTLPQVQNLLAELALLGDVHYMQQLTSYELADPMMRKEWLIALDDEAEKVDKLKGCSLEVEHFLIHFCKPPEDEENDGKAFPRLVLISPQGRRVQVFSKPAITSLFRLQAVFGAMPWRPARLITIVPKEVRGGHVMYKLREG